MGYTHYWRQTGGLAPLDWQTFTQGAVRLVALCPFVLACEFDEPDTPPEFGAELLRFNGVGEDGHETFVIERTPREPADWKDKEEVKAKGVFEFCKTARKPYDAAVTACLAYLDSIHPQAFRADSDGSVDDWRAGLALARAAWPDVADRIRAPDLDD